jgi:hypothetical protein
VQAALVLGIRGFAPKGSLPRLLAEHRGRYHQNEQHFSIRQILAWADAHHARTGKWPHCKSGPIPECPASTWRAVETALTSGGHGLPGGSSITRLLVERRAIRHRFQPLDLTIPQILAWAEAFLARTGQWPNRRSGPLLEAQGESWRIIERALRTGGRGLEGGLSLRHLRDPAKHHESAQASGRRGRSAPERA